jgi:hypothetical protein
LIEKSERQRKREAARESKKKVPRKPPPVTVVEPSGEVLVFGRGTPLRFRRRRADRALDAPRLLRASPHSSDFESIRRSYDDEGVPRDLHDAGADAVAAEESGYTTSPSSALSSEPEAVSRDEQDRQSREVRAKRERVVMSPLYAIDKELGKLESVGHYKPGKVRFIRKLLNQLGEDAMRSAVE